MVEEGCAYVRECVLLLERPREEFRGECARKRRKLMRRRVERARKRREEWMGAADGVAGCH